MLRLVERALAEGGEEPEGIPVGATFEVAETALMLGDEVREGVPENTTAEDDIAMVMVEKLVGIVTIVSTIDANSPGPHVAPPIRSLRMLINAVCALAAYAVTFDPEGIATEKSGLRVVGVPDTVEHAPLTRVVEVIENAVKTK
ncbi:hypothetical protein MMC34_002639 [Xylographa carneopallida]|nr:hypothetical protein [Xylographa carneopallida]